MPKYRRGSGSVYLKRDWCYIKYYVNGRAMVEATGTQNKAEARRILQTRLGQLAEGRYVGPSADRVTFEDLAEGLLTDYKANERKSLQDAEGKIRLHLRPFFGGRKAQSITTVDVKAFIARRQEEGAKNAQINRELAILKRAFNLAMQAEMITRKPYFHMLAENNARQGFFERAEFEAILPWLPDYARPAVIFAYQTGWRIKSEVFPLTWSQVDLEEGTVRLEVGTTKNKGGRLVYLPSYIQEILESQWREHLAHYSDCPWVFHNQGKRISSFYKAWRTACRKAGLSDRIPHDFRRTAVRNMVRAGIPERVAMEIAGHKTRAVFDRYHIVSSGDLREAAKKMEHGIQPQMVTTLVTIPPSAAEELSADKSQVPVVH